MTTRGRITIPKNIRQQLHLNSGNKIEIAINGESEALIRPVSIKVDDVFGILQTDRKAISVEEMNQGIKQNITNNNRKQYATNKVY